MQKAYEDGLVVQSKPGAVPQAKRFLDDMPGQPITDDWDDIERLHGTNAETLGYPTQKPLALLERIIKASSNKGDVVLDPFCGCGTAVHAAQKLGRSWIGIDITHLAISLIEKRLRDAFPKIQFEVEGTPEDIGGAQNLAERDKYQFQWWAVSLVNAQPYQGKKKGADGGIDGLLFFTDVVDSKPKNGKIVVSVKGGKNVGVTMVKDLITTVRHGSAEFGFFITLAAPTRPMLTEAVKAGYYADNPDYPRIQIFTIEELLKGKRPQYPDISMGAWNFKRAKQETPADDQGKLF